jgi:hypothetical protein
MCCKIQMVFEDKWYNKEKKWKESSKILKINNYNKWEIYLILT